MWLSLVLHDPLHLVCDYYLLKHNWQHDYHLFICTHLHNGRACGGYNTPHLIYYTCFLVLRAKSYLNLDCDWNQCCFTQRLYDSGHHDLYWNNYHHIPMNYRVYDRSYQLRFVPVKPVQLVFQSYCHSSATHALVGNQTITLLSLASSIAATTCSNLGVKDLKIFSTFAYSECVSPLVSIWFVKARTLFI